MSRYGGISRKSVTVCATQLFFLMIRRPPRSTLDRSSAASDVYKRQVQIYRAGAVQKVTFWTAPAFKHGDYLGLGLVIESVSYTHLRAHETVLDLVCRLLLEKKKHTIMLYPTNFTYS